MKARLGNIAILGSTGSIGCSALAIVRANPAAFNVVCLAAGKNAELAIEQAREFEPLVVAMVDEEAAEQVRRALGAKVTVLSGEDGVTQAAQHELVHTVLAAIVGFAGFRSALAAVEAGKHLALANKESLVAGGAVLMEKLSKSESVMVPVDSEHSSIFQCLHTKREADPLRKIILTASGGPFLNTPKADFDAIRPEDAVKHPRWKMGAKISVDSATLMNKGLEVIEAAWCFDLAVRDVGVLVHPQSIVHGMIEFADGTNVAVLYETDMQIPISYALAMLRSENPRENPGPRVLGHSVPRLNLAACADLQFIEPDHDKFPALELCYKAFEHGALHPAVLNAANEVAVNAFLDNRIKFTDIVPIVRESLGGYSGVEDATLEQVLLADTWGRERASELLKEFAQ